MSERTAPTSCPPHHWEVTSRRRDGEPLQHHRCLRCGAEKDIPFEVAARARKGRFVLPGSPSGGARAEGPAAAGTAPGAR